MDPFIRYCDAVCLHIRSRTGRADAYRELRDHLEDHSAALAARGVPDREARVQAVEAMGDPHAVGRELDRLYPYCPPALAPVLLALSLLLLLGSVWMLWGEADLQPRGAPPSTRRPAQTARLSSGSRFPLPSPTPSSGWTTRGTLWSGPAPTPVPGERAGTLSPSNLSPSGPVPSAPGAC